MKTILKALIVLIVVGLTVSSIPVSASTEYHIPNTGITIGVSDDVGINVSYSKTDPGDGVKVFSDGYNSTWCIPPNKSPDGNLDIVIVPVTEPGFWEWITSWI